MARKIEGPVRGASLTELQAAATYARERVQLQRRRLYLGRSTPQRLAELERMQVTAEAALRRAQEPTA